MKHLIFVGLIVLALVGCKSNPVATQNGNSNPPDPEPEITVLYQLNVVGDFIDVRGLYRDCWGDSIIPVCIEGTGHEQWPWSREVGADSGDYALINVEVKAGYGNPPVTMTAKIFADSVLIASDSCTGICCAVRLMDVRVP